MENERKTSSLLDFFAEMQLIFCKDSPFFATLHPYQIEDTRLLSRLPFPRHSIFVRFLDIPDKTSAPPNCTH
nr:hypothetical protein [uncultured Prevotella sp.]